VFNQLNFRYALFSAAGGNPRAPVHRVVRLLKRYTHAAIAAGAVLSASAAAAKETTPPYDQTVENQIQPLIEQLLLRLGSEGHGMKLDGVAVFSGNDKFLPGKIAIGLADLLTSLPKTDPRLPLFLKDFGKIAKLTLADPNESWGIYYYLSGLNRLRKAGLLDQAIDPQTLATLRARLDWRSFVDADTIKPINLANNYYVVALGVARLRAAMGWEDNTGADKLLQKTLEHYRQYSGPYGFADETNGDGRFDRYGILLSGEITEHFFETGGLPPSEVLVWLRKSTDVMMLRLNSEG
jgi:hypothetical protein